MARYLYGGTAADVTTTQAGRLVTGATLTGVWTARTGGTQVTDLLDVTLTGTDEDPVFNLTLPSAGANGVNTAAIQDDAVTAAKIAADAVGASEIAAGPTGFDDPAHGSRQQ